MLVTWQRIFLIQYNSNGTKKQFHLHNSESIRLTAYNNKTKFIVGIVNRHSTLTKIDKFLDNLSTCLSDLTSKNQTVSLAGEMNINLDKLNRTKRADNYINILISNDLLSLITMPTRVTATSATIIDHMNTNDLKHEVIPFDLKSLNTDHYITFCCVKKFENCPKNVKKVFLLEIKTSSTMKNLLWIKNPIYSIILKIFLPL